MPYPPAASRLAGAAQCFIIRLSAAVPPCTHAAAHTLLVGLPLLTWLRYVLPFLAACRFKSLQKRALVEPRRRIEHKKQGKKVEYVHVSWAGRCT